MFTEIPAISEIIVPLDQLYSIAFRQTQFVRTSGLKIVYQVSMSAFVNLDNRIVLLASQSSSCGYKAILSGKAAADRDHREVDGELTNDQQHFTRRCLFRRPPKVPECHGDSRSPQLPPVSQSLSTGRAHRLRSLSRRWERWVSGSTTLEGTLKTVRCVAMA